LTDGAGRRGMLEGLLEGCQCLQLFGHPGRDEEEARGVKSAGDVGGLYGVYG
jgi:hypothetical protein